MLMKITTGTTYNAQMILVTEGQKVDKVENILSHLKTKDLFSGKENELFEIPSVTDDNTYIFIGLGKEEKVNEESLRLSAFKAAKALSKLKVKQASIELPKFSTMCYKTSTKAFVEGLYHAEYGYDVYLSKKNNFSLEEVSLGLLEGKEDKITPILKEIDSIMSGVFLARNLVNEPSITMTPEKLANQAKKELSSLEVDVQILEKSDCEELGMEAFLAVNKGSTNKLQGIIMRYHGGKDEAPIGLVGKGVTFDTGGYSIKPGPSMMTMHGDMGGAGAVIGAMKAIALNKIEKNVVAIILATDNVISGDAYVPGDIIGSMGGKSIEIHSTDAEGRLTLADAVYYAVKNEGVKEVIDVATLTGACVVALAEFHTGAFTNDEDMLKRVQTASEEAGEPMWRLPLTKDHHEMIKGTRSDIKNTGGRWGGASTAAAFIETFVEDTPWVHLDIAGTSDLAKARGYLPSGATGAPVKTLYYYVKGEKRGNC